MVAIQTCARLESDLSQCVGIREAQFSHSATLFVSDWDCTKHQSKVRHAVHCGTHSSLCRALLC